jgi:hypothetical protein
LWQISKDAGGQWQRHAIDFRGRKWDCPLDDSAETILDCIAMVLACGGIVEAASVPPRTLYRSSEFLGRVLCQVRNEEATVTAASTKLSVDTNEFRGKRVLVTGGTRDAGKAIAARFLEGGATVITTARSRPQEKAESHFIQADVSTSEGTTIVIRELLDRFKGVDIVVHNVGGSSAPSRGFITVTDELTTPPSLMQQPKPRSPTTARPCRTK